MSSSEISNVPEGAATSETSAPAVQRRPARPASKIWRRATMRRAIGEGVVLYALGIALALPRPDVWPVPLFIAVILLRLTLFILPPVWAAMRVVSTKREKMSRRFWRLGPILAAWCTLVSLGVALFIGQPDLQWGGLTTGPALGLFFASGKAHLAPLAFFTDQLGQFVKLALYYAIAVVLTRLANGGFLRFTMPSGNGRVTL